MVSNPRGPDRQYFLWYVARAKRRSKICQFNALRLIDKWSLNLPNLGNHSTV